MKNLLKGPCEGGLYPLKSHSPSQQSSNKHVLGAFKPSTSLWHSRLGHASSQSI